MGIGPMIPTISGVSTISDQHLILGTFECDIIYATYIIIDRYLKFWSLAKHESWWADKVEAHWHLDEEDDWIASDIIMVGIELSFD